MELIIIVVALFAWIGEALKMGGVNPKLIILVIINI